LKRLALTALHYSKEDVQDFEFLLCYKAHACLGVAVWEPENVSLVSKDSSIALLHGLYVAQQHQHCGVGKSLLNEVHRRAKKRDVAGIYVRAERFSASYFDHVGYHQLADNQGPGASECAFPHRFMRDLAARHSNAA
jgi:N-acetylglutamate synthase-like GNAT family acetyltransferase